MIDEVSPLFELPNFKESLQLLKKKRNIKLTGLFGASKAIYLAYLQKTLKMPILVLDEEVEELFEELSSICSYTYLFLESASAQYKMLHALENHYPIIVAEQLHKVVDKEGLKSSYIKLCTNMELNQEVLLEKLLSFGFVPCYMAQEEGDFAKRGSIIDIVQERGWRVEFAFEKIESIREFDTDTQASLKKVDEVIIYSRKERERKGSLFDYISEGVMFGERVHEREGFFTILSGVLMEKADIDFAFLPAPYFAQNLEKFLSFIKEEEREVVIATLCKERIISITKEAKREIKVIEAALKKGFLSPSLILLTDEEIFGHSFIQWKKRFDKKAQDIFDVLELEEGDYVVHAKYGIGRYKGLKTMVVDGVKREYMVIEYKDEDTLYVPAHQLHMVQKYIASRKKPPSLSKIGTKTWNATKRRVQQDVLNTARQLLHIQALRKAKRGYAYSPDTLWQHEFEAQFPYTETPDQIKAIEEVKADLQRPFAMDRVVCGDVGFGKTEIAARAAFKVCCEGRQVALLAPTTILAQQHYHTFCERFSSYPINIKMLSRFHTKGEQRKILKDLEEGKIDILIGTHRILSDDVKFKSLGLLIIDEEHRFGVKQKEKIKTLHTLVDVLTLTATPIPRTLYMIISGIRDVSMMHTPIPGRKSIETFVQEFDIKVIKEAIEREVERGGQVFFVNDRIAGLQNLYNLLKKHLPHIRIKIAHGRMSEKELSSVILEFLNGEFEVLLSTTIIEAGLHLPNVNTLFVNNAQNFGLAQLYQIRGRIGRGTRKAYAYFLYPKNWPITKSTAQRLYTLKMLTEPGSGYKIALKDLQIRGAGNILGTQQHGDIAAVGLELYCKLLQEAVATLKGEEIAEDFMPQVELPFDAFIPPFYIEDEGQRFIFYKKICAAKNKEELEKIKEELLDRFGPLPKEVENLLTLFYIRCLCKNTLVASICYREKGEIIIEFFREIEGIEKFFGKNASFFPDKKKILIKNFCEEEIINFLCSIK